MSCVAMSAVLRVERIAQAIAGEIQRKQRRTKKMAGKISSHGALCMFLAPSEISVPQLVSGAWTPRPRKDRKLSSRITLRHDDGDEDDDRADRVRDDVPADDLPVGEAERFGRAE